MNFMTACMAALPTADRAFGSRMQQRIGGIIVECDLDDGRGHFIVEQLPSISE